MANNFTPVIGLEIHVELATQSKMFCGCQNDPFGAKKPNIYTCPVCLGLPGSLPVPNKKAVHWTLMIGLALNCEINLQSKFDRKHYFYPDLPKGYQISQYDQPFCQKGSLHTAADRKISINRVHLEEDTGKLIHATIKGKEVSLVDFNRSGVPLVEIVSEPDLPSAAEAKEYVKKIQQIIRYLGASDCDMEKGSMRLEANISVKTSDSLPSYKVEVKNLNSFRFLQEAIDYEISRQTRLLKAKKKPVQETRGWDEASSKTTSQRTKEEAQDYRYFPEPDIPPLKQTREQIKALKASLPELPEAKRQRLVKEYGISKTASNIMTAIQSTADYFEAAAKEAKNHKIASQKIANVIINKQVDIKKNPPSKFVQILLKKAESRVSDPKTLEAWVDLAIKQNQAAVADYRQGKQAAIGFLIGQVQRLAQGKADAVKVQAILHRKLRKKIK